MTPGPTPPTALFVSPHLDDVAFSCGGTVAGLKRLGWRVAVVTVFTRSVAGPAGFALACQLDKGLDAAVDYLALRRAEDAEAGQILGVDRLAWLDLPEAPHRGYDSAPALFAGVRPDDPIVPAIRDRLAPLVAEWQPASIFAPQSVGNHVDHLQVVRALLDPPWASCPLAWYRDLPYASKFPEARPTPDLPADLVEVAFALDPGDLDRKVRGSAAYRTQVPFQFGSVAAVATVLGDFAAAEGDRFEARGPVETFRVDPAAVPAWADMTRPPGGPGSPGGAGRTSPTDHGLSSSTRGNDHGNAPPVRAAGDA